MNPPAMLYIDWPTKVGDDDPIPAWTDRDKLRGDVPYMLAQPEPIETAPMDGTPILVYMRITLSTGEVHCKEWRAAQWDGSMWIAHRSFVPIPGECLHWLPMPPNPEQPR